MFTIESVGLGLSLTIFIVLFLAYIRHFMADLSKGMSMLSNTAILIAVDLTIWLYFMEVPELEDL